MVPAPRTATVRIASGFKGELQSEKTKLQQHHAEVTKSRLTGSDGPECTAKRALPISKTPSLVLRSAKAGLQSSHGGYGLPFDGERDGVAPAQAERADSAMHVAALHFIQEGHENARARGPDGMSNGNRTAVNIDLGGIKTQFADDGDRLHGECFV